MLLDTKVENQANLGQFNVTEKEILSYLKQEEGESIEGIAEGLDKVYDGVISVIKDLEAKGKIIPKIKKIGHDRVLCYYLPNEQKQKSSPSKSSKQKSDHAQNKQTKKQSVKTSKPKKN